MSETLLHMVIHFPNGDEGEMAWPAGIPLPRQMEGFFVFGSQFLIEHSFWEMHPLDIPNGVNPVYHITLDNDSDRDDTDIKIGGVV